MPLARRCAPADPTSLVLNGFQGDDYVLVGDQLVIVDVAVRQVVAISKAT